MDPSELAARLRRLAPSLAIDVERNPEAAVQRALTAAPRVAAAGSIFLVGPLRARLLAAGAVSLQGR
jgi:hypothetical protein